MAAVEDEDDPPVDERGGEWSLNLIKMRRHLNSPALKVFEASAATVKCCRFEHKLSYIHSTLFLKALVRGQPRSGQVTQTPKDFAIMSRKQLSDHHKTFRFA